MILDKIYCPEEQRERADKALRLNGFTDKNKDQTNDKDKAICRQGSASNKWR